MLVWASQQAFLHSSLQYRAGNALGCIEVASGKWVCRASEFASDMPSCKHYTARQTVCYMSGVTWSQRGHHCRKTWPQEPFHFSISTPSSHHTRDLNSCSQNLELGVLTKWLHSWMLVWVSRQASLQFFFFISQLNYALKTLIGQYAPRKFHLCEQRYILKNWQRERTPYRWRLLFIRKNPKLSLLSVCISWLKLGKMGAFGVVHVLLYICMFESKASFRYAHK